MKICEMPETEKPRAKAKLYGLRSLSNAELLSILIRTGTRGMSVVQTSEKVLQKAGGLNGLARLSTHELMEIDGIGEVKALEIASVFEINRRMALENVCSKDVIDRPEELVDWLQKEIGSSLQEEFLVVYLNHQHRIAGYQILFKGTIDMSMVYPREIFRHALLYNSTELMLVHNHPGGNVRPSREDMLMTREIINIAGIMGMTVLDHLIVSGQNFCSMHREGLLPSPRQPEATAIPC